MKIVKPSVELLWITPDAVKMIEKAGRTCYRSGDKIAEGSADKFIKMLHRSPPFILYNLGNDNDVCRHYQKLPLKNVYTVLGKLSKKKRVGRCSIEIFLSFTEFRAQMNMKWCF